MLIMICGILAVWRIVHLLAYEAGPFEVLVKIRSRLDGTELAQLMDCVKCSSVWVGAPIALLVTSDLPFFLVWLALSAGAILLDEIYVRVLRGYPL